MVLDKYSLQQRIRSLPDFSATSFASLARSSKNCHCRGHDATSRWRPSQLIRKNYMETTGKAPLLKGTTDSASRYHQTPLAPSVFGLRNLLKLVSFRCDAYSRFVPKADHEAKMTEGPLWPRSGNRVCSPTPLRLTLSPASLEFDLSGYWPVVRYLAATERLATR